MKAFLITTALIWALAALVTINTKPGAPRTPHGTARQLMVTLTIELGFSAWAVWLLWSAA